MAAEKPTSPQKGAWAFTPALPLNTSPYFRFPSALSGWLGWLVRSWLPLTERLVFFALAWASWIWLTPQLAPGTGFEFSWIALVWVKNIGLMTVLAGGLHMYLYSWGGQGKARKFDRSMANKDASRFTFGHQLYDNIFWSLVSGVSIWTGFEALLLWAQANTIGYWTSFSDNPVLFIALFVVIPSWNSFWFFCIHRALHWPPLYRLAHHVHHRNVSVGPWSGNAMHPLEHLIWMAGALAYIPVICHPVHFIFSQQLSILGAVTSHSGYEGLVIGGKRIMRLGDFFHQLHHRFYECNYGTAEVGLDRLHNSFHDGQTPPPSLKAASQKTKR
ncbi:sterol desaturase [SAR116 cluster alpha proteobacterium HIMB100]|nr:sterol desaturase [SAR116 cluster alpha proteobacterium HIMB100]